jgi:hypothetical protein
MRSSRHSDRLLKQQRQAGPKSAQVEPVRRDDVDLTNVGATMLLMRNRWLVARRDAWIDAVLAQAAVPLLLAFIAVVLVGPPLITATVVGCSIWLLAQKKNCPD